MADLIGRAIQKAKQKAINSVDVKLPDTDIVGNYKKQINDKFSSVSGRIQDPLAELDRIKNLPSVKTPELLKQEAEALVQAQMAEFAAQRQKIVEDSADTVKRAVELYVMFQLRSIPIPKLPIIDPKTLAWLAYLKIRNEIMELKQKLSRENLKKAKDKFSYPIKLKKPEVKKPSFKEIPRLF